MQLDPLQMFSVMHLTTWMIACLYSPPTQPTTIFLHLLHHKMGMAFFVTKTIMKINKNVTFWRKLTVLKHHTWSLSLAFGSPFAGATYYLYKKASLVKISWKMFKLSYFPFLNCEKSHWLMWGWRLTIRLVWSGIYFN